MAKYLNIGGGNFRREDWLNLDCQFEATKHKRDWSLIDINHNLMSFEDIPLEDNSMKAIYSEHTIEHLTEEAVVHMLLQCLRILIPGGVLRISCPDADWMYHEYFKNPLSDLYPRSKQYPDSREAGLLDIIATPIVGVLPDEDVRYIMTRLFKVNALESITEHMDARTANEQSRKPGDHLSWWNANKLHALLYEFEFDEIQTCGRNESRLKVFRDPAFDKTAHYRSVRVEAIKPIIPKLEA